MSLDLEQDQAEIALDGRTRATPVVIRRVSISVLKYILCRET